MSGGNGEGSLFGRVPRPPTYPERRRRQPVRLGERPRRILRAIAEVVAPARDLGFDPGAAAIDFVEGYLPYIPPPLARAFPLGLRAIDWAALFVLGRPARASRLPRAVRAEVFRRLARSRLQPLRELWHAVRGMVAMGIYSRPEVHAAIGYAPQPFIDERVRLRRERFGAPEPW